MITDSNPIGTLSTISGNKPHSRYISFQREGITLFTATSKQTHKVEEIQENPNVHVLLGYEDWNDPYIELQGTVTVRDGKELKEEFWHDMMKHWFSGPEDPNYIILEIKPSVYRLMNAKEREPVEMKL